MIPIKIPKTNLLHRAYGRVLRIFSPYLSDELYLKLLFRHHMGCQLNLDNPKTFNEKLQWLKLYNRNPLYTVMVDKVKAKKYVASKIGEQYIIPTLGVWENADDVDFNSLPSRFVIKCNHNSGKGMYICKDRSKMNVEKIRNGLRKGLRENYYLHGREWPYKDVPRRIIAEQYMESKDRKELQDYKFFCFNGEPRLCQVISDRSTDGKIDFYDMQWNRIIGLLEPCNDVFHNSDIDFPCPTSFNEMKRCAHILAEGMPFSRIDFYDIDGKAFFGEITFFPTSGLGMFSPESWSEKTGNWITLPIKQ